MQNTKSFNIKAALVMIGVFIIVGAGIAALPEVDARAEQQQVDDRRDAQKIREWIRYAELGN